MFNLKAHNASHDLLQSELRCYDIVPTQGGYRIRAGDEDILCSSADECIQYIERAVQELKDSLWDKWSDLGRLSHFIASQPSFAEAGIEYKLFLSNVKKSTQLANRFSELESIEQSIRTIYQLDISQVGVEAARDFNRISMQIRVLHHLVMREMYRLRLLQRATKKTASVAGPWQNLDLEMEERVWEWDQQEVDYFGDRQKEKRDSPRYNPEYNPQGFYFWFDDKNRDPYSWKDRKDESPYPILDYTSTP